MRCKKHRRYKAILKPRVSCVDCWLMFLAKDVDLYTIEMAIKYYEEELGCDTIEKADNDTIVHSLLKAKKNEIMENKV